MLGHTCAVMPCVSWPTMSGDMTDMRSRAAASASGEGVPCAWADGTARSRTTSTRMMKRMSIASSDDGSAQVKLFELPVLGSDPAHRAGDRAHDHRVGFDRLPLELDAAQHGAVGDAGGGEQAIAAHHV